MTNINIKNNIQELPVKLQISFRKLYQFISQYTSEENTKHPFHSAALKVKEQVEKLPFLIDGFSDFDLIEKHRDIIDIMLEPLFPEILQHNEIKAAMLPFSFKSFRLSTRFQNIVKNAGDNFELKIRNFDYDLMYRQVCAFILQVHYGYAIDLSRPFYFDIPNSKTGITHHYRVGFNADFFDFEVTDLAPNITEEDYKALLNNFDDINLWKQKFPPNSYIFKGFGIMNLFDVTTDQTITDITKELLTIGEDISDRIEIKLRDFFKIKDLKVGFSVYDFLSNNVSSTLLKKHQSIVLNDEVNLINKGFLCNHVTQKIFKDHKPVTICDVEDYGNNTNQNEFYTRLKSKNVGSIIIIPIVTDDDNLVLVEIISPRPYELNAINQNKLQEIIPVFKIAIERSNIEYKNAVEAIIQENYTSIHPSVKWKFKDAAERYQRDLFQKKDNPKIEEIIFENVYPLYGQIDIKDSSIARNNAIKADLITQLNLAISVLQKACKTEKIPIYNELMFRVKICLDNLKSDLKSGDETSILNFLKREIYPAFKHIKKLNTNLEQLVNNYTDSLDKNLKVVYDKRKAYENSVSILNDTLSSFIDKKQIEAQQMFPHYFERYKTDGIEYNMYIGQSLVKEKTYDSVYLHNMQLWQLQLMCEMENLAFKTAEQIMQHKLQVASLILVHSNPLAIKFRMDEKQFDVDGAYNIRYEIIKKRIDKANIKGKTERLTQPQKIAIVYAQNKDAIQYKKYIKYLQSKNKLGKLEELELEDLQGVSGLKALRVEVIYQKDFCDKASQNINELLKEFK